MLHLLNQALAQPQGLPIATEAPPALWQALATNRDGPAFLPPVRGTVYGTLLNHRAALAALGDAVTAARTRHRRRRRCSTIKPRNTLTATASRGVAGRRARGRDRRHARHRDRPHGVPRRPRPRRWSTWPAIRWSTTCRVPHATRSTDPSMRLQCARRLLPDRARWSSRARVADPDALEIAVAVDGDPVQRGSTGGASVRPVALLIADVTEFMTLHPGDVLMLGVADGAPRARAGSASVAVDDRRPRAGSSAAGSSGPRRPGGRHEDRARRLRRRDPRRRPIRPSVRLADGRVLREDEVVWLPPFEAGTIIALGLNYADHVKELSKELTLPAHARDEPLVFLKSPGALIGHRGSTRRPADVAFMHYECELAVVIGAPACKRARAPRRCSTWRATRSATTTPSATTSRTGTARTCA